MTDIHALIQDFLQQQTIVPLAKEDAAVARFTKAGIVPFMRQMTNAGGQQADSALSGVPLRGQETEQGTILYYVMKPLAKQPALGAPPFQLCKGTRMFYAPGEGWQDMRAKDDEQEVKESLAATALREGIEELGLILSNIRRIFDVGPYGFSSATTGKDKKMWMFAAELTADEFLPASDVAATTAERKWLSASEFAVVGRQDHRYILQDIEKKLIQTPQQVRGDNKE